jgi:hypothetical protein
VTTLRRRWHHPRAVAPEFLPPDPYADVPAPAPREFAPPQPATEDRTRLALVLGCAGLGVAVISYGALAVLTLPASTAAAVLGARSRRGEPRPRYADAAVIIAVVGIVLGLLLGVLWIVSLINGDVTTIFDRHDGGGDRSDLTFQVARLLR